jgi:hypothetical protein
MLGLRLEYAMLLKHPGEPLPTHCLPQALICSTSWAMCSVAGFPGVQQQILHCHRQTQKLRLSPALRPNIAR